MRRLPAQAGPSAADQIHRKCSRTGYAPIYKQTAPLLGYYYAKDQLSQVRRPPPPPPPPPPPLASVDAVERQIASDTRRMTIWCRAASALCDLRPCRRSGPISDLVWFWGVGDIRAGSVRSALLLFGSADQQKPMFWIRTGNAVARLFRRSGLCGYPGPCFIWLVG